MALVLKNPACQCRRHRNADLIPGSGRSPGGGHGNPLHYSCLENPMDSGAWRAAAVGSQRVRHAWSRLAHTHTHTESLIVSLDIVQCQIIIVSKGSLLASLFCSTLILGTSLRVAPLESYGSQIFWSQNPFYSWNVRTLNTLALYRLYLLLFMLI